MRFAALKDDELEYLKDKVQNAVIEYEAAQNREKYALNENQRLLADVMKTANSCKYDSIFLELSEENIFYFM